MLTRGQWLEQEQLLESRLVPSLRVTVPLILQGMQRVQRVQRVKELMTQ